MRNHALYGSFRDPGSRAFRSLQESLDSSCGAGLGFADDEDVLAHLLALNLSIAREEEGGITQPRSPGFEGLPEAESLGSESSLRTTSE